MREFQILKEMDHPNILRIHELFQDEKHYYLVSEHCEGGNVLDLVKKTSHFSEWHAMLIMKQILSAVQYCHQMGVIHRDIKAENILFSKNSLESTVKVIDFGISIKYERDSIFKDKVGTVLYIAPEVLNGSYNEKCDIWSCGVLMFILLSGEPPFYSNSREEILRKIKSGEFNMEGSAWNKVSEESKDLIRTMLTIDPECRPSAVKVLTHSWFSQDKELPPLKSKEYFSNISKIINYSRLAHAVLAFIVTNIAHNDASEDALRLFKDLDSNGDGKLTRDELIKGYAKAYEFMSKEQIEAKVTAILESIDTDNSGTIDFTEYLVAAMRKEMDLSKNKIKAAFEAFDIDGDGEITKQEFMSVIKGITLEDREWVNFIHECDGENTGKVGSL